MHECGFPADPSEVAALRSRSSDVCGLEGRNILDDMANCMKDGPLQNRTITPDRARRTRAARRSTTKHLAAAAADAARNYLVKKGVNRQETTGGVARRAKRDGRRRCQLGARPPRRSRARRSHTDRTNISQNPAANAKKAAPKPGSAYADQTEGGAMSGKASGSSGPGSASSAK